MKPLLILIIAASFIAPPAFARKGGGHDRLTDAERAEIIMNHIDTWGHWPDHIHDDWPSNDSVHERRPRKQKVRMGVRCKAVDRNNYTYRGGVVRGTNNRSINKAVRVAVKTCKKKSRLPRTCRFLKKTCFKVRI